MIREQPALPDTGARRSPWVWVFVTEQGTVAAAQVVPSAGIDFDIAALARAKQLKFSPAQLKGSPVAAWFLVAVETIAAPEGCPTMAVPISAGVATFADSAVLDRPELGTLYRYQGMDGLPLDVFIYPRSDWPTPTDQVGNFVRTLNAMRERGDLSTYEVQNEENLRLKVRGGRPRRDMVIEGRSVRARLTAVTGEQRTTYYAVFPEGDKYIKFRATYPPARRTEKTIAKFVWQVLSARVSTPPHCSR